MAAAALLAVAATSCKETPPDTIAHVGDQNLTLTEVHLHMPLGLSSADSAAFVSQYVEQWKEEQLVFQEGLKNVSNLDQINKEVEDYRRRLVSETYIQEVIANRVHGVTDDECEAFYQKHTAELKLPETIVKAVFVKVLNNSSKVPQLRKWLEEILQGNTEHIEELEQYCQQRAVGYDNFFNEWNNLSRLTEQLHITVIEPSSFLKVKVYEMKDEDYIYLAAVADYRLEGETQPIEYAMNEIHEMLGQQHRQQAYNQLIQELKDNRE